MAEEIKQSIIQLLKNTTAHPTAKEIFLALEEKVEKIDKKSFLEELNTLEKNQEIISIPSIDKIKHYDIKIHPHYHFICNNCGSVRDLHLESGAINMLKDHAQRLINSFGKIDKVNLSFQGICHSCRKK